MRDYGLDNPHFKEAITAMKKVLGESYYTLEKSQLWYAIFHDKDTQEIGCSLKLGDFDIDFVEPREKGTTSAFFNGLFGCLVKKYPSLVGLSLYSFSSRAEGKQTKINMTDTGFDVAITVELSLRNRRGDIFTFQKVSVDSVHGAFELLLTALLFFVNSERAFVKFFEMKRLDREKNHREFNTELDSGLAILVRNNDYVAIVDAMRQL